MAKICRQTSRTELLTRTRVRLLVVFEILHNKR